MKLESIIPEKILDMTDLNRPLPILKPKKALFEISAWGTKCRYLQCQNRGIL